MFLVVINDGGGDIKKVAAIEVFAASHAQIVDENTAQQAQTGGLDADGGTGELQIEFGENLTAHGAGIGPRLIQQGDQDRDAQDGEDQTSDEPLPPGHEFPVCETV